jgi:hypothetical protein
MRSGRTTFLKIAVAFSSAAIFSCLHAADAPARSTNAAPEKIEFSRTTSTTPGIPRPGSRTDDLLERYGNVRENTGNKGPDFAVPSAPTTPILPSKAAAEKLLKEWDKKRNWAVPGAQDQDSESANPLEKTDDPEKELSGENRDGVMERYLKGELKSKDKNPNAPRLRDLDRDRDRTNNRVNDGSGKGRKDRDDADDKDENDKSRDPNDNKDSNGLADFNLKRFLQQQNQPNFLNTELPKASQMFRSDFGARPGYREDRERAQTRERDAARSAEFMQILKPRTGGATFVGVGGGVNDPINSPDLTRREMNPITPRVTEGSTLGSSPFATPPASPASRIQENNMFGVTGPAAAASITPPIVAPPAQEIRARPIVIEPPRRIGSF